MLKFLNIIRDFVQSEFFLILVFSLVVCFGIYLILLCFVDFITTIYYL